MFKTSVCWRTLTLTGAVERNEDRLVVGSTTKFAVVAETAAFNEAGLSEYYRHKGLHPEQVNAWGEVAITSQHVHREESAHEELQTKSYRKQIKQLE